MEKDYFAIVVGVLQGDTLATYLIISCLDYVLRTSIYLMKENGFKQAKEISRRYPAQNNTDTGYADLVAFLTNTPAQAKSLLHSLERAVGGIVLHAKADKRKYTYFHQRGNCSPLKGGPLKLADSSPTSEKASHQTRMT